MMFELVAVLVLLVGAGALIYLVEQLPSRGVDLNWKPPVDGFYTKEDLEEINSRDSLV